MKQFFLFIFLIFSTKSFLHAAPLDLNIQNQLIEKLSAVVNEAQDSSEMVQQASLVLRLADLYSERSRLLTVAEEGIGAQKYKTEIESDRRQALELYKRVIKRLDVVEAGRVRMQSAHLLLLLGDEAAAQKELVILSKENNKEAELYRAQAFIQLADLDFNKSNFIAAKALFEKAQKLAANPRKAYVESRISWCLLNMGQSQLAEKKLTQLLENRSLFTNKDGEVDQAFLEESSKDLATFMAKNDVNVAKIQLLKRLSPANVQQVNLIHLATELDRTSKKKSALLVWAHVDQKAITFNDQVNKQIQLARIQYDLGQKDQLVLEVKKVLQLIAQKPCQKDPECLLQTQNLRSLLTDWGKAEERIPSRQLIQAYVEFLKYHEDFELAYWAGQAAMTRKEFINAFKMFKLASSYKSLHEKIKSEDKDPRYLRIFEGSLLSAIDAAEQTKNKNTQLDAYTHYLKFNPEGEKSWEVRYQIAMLYYELNQFQESSPRFREIALSSQASGKLRSRSADLYFDALALQKNDAKIEAEALYFSKNFASQRSQFEALWRKAILNQTAAVLSDSKSSQSDLTEQYEKISQLQVSQWPQEQRKQLTKNSLLLAYRVKDLLAVERTVNLYLKQSLKPNERNEAYLALAWSQEMRLQFAQAAATLKKVQIKGDKKSQVAHHFKIALMNELAKSNAQKSHETVLSLVKSGPLARFSAHQLILSGRGSKQSRLMQYQQLLSQDRQLLASAALAVLDQTKTSPPAEKILLRKNLVNTAETSLFKTAQELKRLPTLKKDLYLRLRGSDQQVQVALKKRMRAIAQVERFIQSGIRSGDVSVQFVGLVTLAQANESLVKDILKLPLPRGLKAQEKIVYQNQIQAQTEPYQQQAKSSYETAKNLFREKIEGRYLQDLIFWSESTTRPGSRLAKAEVNSLKAHTQAIGGSDRVFVKMTEERQQLYARSLSLQKDVSQSPFDINDLQNLKDIQSQLGHGPWVAYLNMRISDLSVKGNLKGDNN